MARIAYPWNMKPLLGGLFIKELIGRADEDYMTRIHLTPWRWWPFPKRLYLHHFRTADHDPVPHDHPFGFRSIILLGGYTERVYNYRTDADMAMPRGRVITASTKDSENWYDVRRRAGTTHRVAKSHCHRIIALHGRRTVTLVIRGKKEQDWGFFVPDYERGVVKVPWWKYIGLPAPDRSAY
jgi:hypothetical protein